MKEFIRRFGLLIALTLVGGGAGAAYAALKTPTYTAKAYVVAIADKSEPMTALNFAQAYGRIATSGPVLAQARARLADPAGLSRVRSSTSPDAPVIEITANGSSAGHTTDLANAVAGALADYGSLRSNDTDVKLSVLAAATVPVRPTAPKPPLELAVGGAAGLIIGGLAALAGARRTATTTTKVEEVERVEEAQQFTGVAWVKPPPAITAYRSTGDGELTVVTNLTPPLRTEPPRTEAPRTEPPRTEAPRTEVPPAEPSPSEPPLAERASVQPPLIQPTVFQPTVVRAPQRAVGRAVVAGTEEDE